MLVFQSTGNDIYNLEVIKPTNDKVMETLWSDLPEELVEVIMSKLVFTDQARVRAVCKTWQSLRQIQPARQLPWLFVNDRNKSSKYYLYDPLYKKTNTFKGTGFTELGFIENNLPNVHCSKNGFLLLESGTLVLLYNPFTYETIKFPPIQRVDLHNSKFDATFECPPRSADYLICAMEFDLFNLKLPFYIRICRSKDKSWTTITTKPNFRFPKGKIAYKDGAIYCIDNSGSVAIFDIAQDSWISIAPFTRDPKMWFRDKILVDAGDEVLFVEKEYYKSVVSSVYCFRIDRSQNRCVKLKSLGGQVLFWNYYGNVLVPKSATPEEIRDGVCVDSNCKEYHKRNCFSLKDGRRSVYFSNYKLMKGKHLFFDSNGVKLNFSSGISRDSMHKRRATGGKKKAWRKKRKYEMGRQPANTKLSSNKTVRIIRVRGGNRKIRALRLDTGNYSWGSEAVTRKTRILDVVYNASNNELVRTQTLVKSAIVQIDAAPFKQWYLQHYGVDVGRKKKSTAPAAAKKEGEEDEAAAEEAKKSNHVVRKIEKRQLDNKLDSHIEEQFNGGRLLAAIASRPGQCGRADGYILEGKELEFYMKKLQKKKGKGAAA
ncbi:hypothetical protein GIB67_013368 [Kingdonia uniflora]|uniref:40S ribosomal protein S8 n=1 Tax=Kingdonia uniflora TaxID=39325 RepID=A0A7J7LQW3_9MAGN|nr:hypothetical protein GIB67_013368 [Kingdonia uniflora]